LDKKIVNPITKEIHIKGARTNNLKNIETRIPKNKLVVITGVSGSGKSSLLIDTLYAEGQRRYVESMSSYARQFLGRMKKPDVDFIKGISPAIAIEQKVTSSNARSTVGSLTEIYDYLRLLYARIGETRSPVSGNKVKKHEVSDVIDALERYQEDAKVVLFAPLNIHDTSRSTQRELELLLQKGFTRVKVRGEIEDIQDILDGEKEVLEKPITEVQKSIQILVDRFKNSRSQENVQRMADSILTAFYEGGGECILEINGEEILSFNNRFELDGITFLEPNPQLFNYNNPYGACRKCEGYGQVLGIDEQKVIPDRERSLYEGAVACWKGEKHGRWLDRFITYAEDVDFPIHSPYKDLTEDQRDILWNGRSYIKGINDFFSELQEKSYKIQNRVMIARYRGRTVCPVCSGGRLRKEASYVKVSGKSISELIDLSILDLYAHFQSLELTDYQTQVAKRILFEIENRLQVMCDIGLSYLTLNRTASSLSGGETQRINLTRTLGSNLTSSMYILDEPSIGLHPHDTSRLLAVLKRLRDLGNTVLVVEHEEDIIRNADHLLDLGPQAGIHGGEIVYDGPLANGAEEKTESLTVQYLYGLKNVPLPVMYRQPTDQIRLMGVRQHNLKHIDVTIPLNALTVVSGVSGSGKTSLVRHVLYSALLKELGISHPSRIGLYDRIEGDIERIKGIEFVGQNPIGRSSRSNPVTYVKAYDDIRKLMIKQQLSKIRGYKLKHFSFNTEGGRCENCKGEGAVTIEMQFLADVKLICEDCQGQRFKKEILEVKFNEKSIYEILDLSISESLEFFKDQPSVLKKLLPLDDVGLGYVKLGQPSSTLSGGEAQRLKLASYLGKESQNQHQLFIFDEPTTGLHFDDINKLLGALNSLIEAGNTVLIVEHNLDVIKSADWVIDLGPVGGDKGGYLVYEGDPMGLAVHPGSITAPFLKHKMSETTVSANQA
jgi:excinuclease ABC subunit A